QMNYQFRETQYTDPGQVSMEVWDGLMPSDEGAFDNAITASRFSSPIPAYTINIARTGFPPPVQGLLNISVNSDWLAEGGSLSDGRKMLYVFAEGRNSNGNLVGTILPVRYACNDSAGHIEYFEVDLPQNYNYFTKFTVAKLSGSGNLFQMVTFEIVSFISQQSAGGPDSGGGQISPAKATPLVATPVQNITSSPTPVPPDPGKTVALYTNNQGVITQASVLLSTDRLANLTIGTGVLAMDSRGKPVTSITIRALQADEFPAASFGDGLAFSGMAYDLKPEGATFSPAVTIRFRVPDAPWGRKYSVKSYNRAAGAWEDLPTIYDPATGSISADIPHFCCIALFALSPSGQETPVTRAVAPAAVPSVAAPSLPPTAISIVTGMVLWAAGILGKNLFVAVGIVVVICLLFYLRRRRKGLDRIRYLF
ncbi:MAG TPA: hypothetical protein VLY83_00750, partial [Methanoregula sp.]|nr:hypothetical protein [Methanoregula sp.]